MLIHNKLVRCTIKCGRVESQCLELLQNLVAEKEKHGEGRKNSKDWP